MVSTRSGKCLLPVKPKTPKKKQEKKVEKRGRKPKPFMLVGCIFNRNIIKIHYDWNNISMWEGVLCTPTHHPTPNTPHSGIKNTYLYYTGRKEGIYRNHSQSCNFVITFSLHQWLKVKSYVTLITNYESRFGLWQVAKRISKIWWNECRKYNFVMSHCC